MEQFNLDKWLKDKSRKVVTRDGKPVRIVCWDAKVDERQKEYHIIALVDSAHGEDCSYFNEQGAEFFKREYLYLFFADKEENLSENEKIRKAILKMITDMDGGYPFEKYGIIKKDAIAWLEKQGEQEHVESEQTCYHNDGLYYAIDILEKTLGKVEGYQSDDGMIEHQKAIETVNALYHKKPAVWSEEDEYQINTILHGLDLKRELYKKEGNKVEEERYSTQYNWLKSIKEKIQPNKEWSGEDERIINDAIWLIEHYATDGHKKLLREQTIDKLKSLKPQNRWKPTEKQMEALKFFIDYHQREANAATEGWEQYKNLKELYNGLQKL